MMLFWKRIFPLLNSMITLVFSISSVCGRQFISGRMGLKAGARARRRQRCCQLRFLEGHHCKIASFKHARHAYLVHKGKPDESQAVRRRQMTSLFIYLFIYLLIFLPLIAACWCLRPSRLPSRVWGAEPVLEKKGGGGVYRRCEVWC